MGPVQWLADGRLDLDRYLEVLTGGHPVMVDGLPTRGVQAVMRRDGFGPDGSYYYHDEILGHITSKDRRFASSFRMVATNQALLHHRETMSEAGLETLKLGYEKLRKAGVSVVTAVMPVAPRVIDEMARRPDEFGYIAEARARLSEINESHYDFYDPRVLGADDCEFVGFRRE